MMTSKEQILQRVRTALQDVKSRNGLTDATAPETVNGREADRTTRVEERKADTNKVKAATGGINDATEHEKATSENPVAVPDEIVREYRRSGYLSADERTQMFAENVADYKARVSTISENEVPETVADICRSEGVKKLVIPPGFPDNWLPVSDSGVTLLRDQPEPLSNRELDESDAVLTGCFRAVAQTGTIVLNAGPGQGRRTLTLLPDFHICVVQAGQIREILPEVISELEPTIRDNGSPVTFISGPSATSDIELDRVEGVHGPRRLHVIILSDNEKKF